MDTIFALASGGGKAGVAVVRVSGPLAVQALQKLGGFKPKPRYASLQTLKNDDGIVIDECLVLFFEKGASFTGDEIVELHLHGSRAIVQLVLSLLGEINGCRIAEPGEFTRRAMDAGRLDLVQVEGLADLIDAETEQQRRLAQQLFQGTLSNTVDVWRDALIEARAFLEVTIDFADEDVPVDVSDDVVRILDTQIDLFKRSLNGLDAAKSVRNGIEIAIVGLPNAGKSTLLNALAGREIAITSEIAGTTRDIIEARLDLGGVPVTFLDTAGLRDTDDQIESIGVDRAQTRAQGSDIRVFLGDPEEISKVAFVDGDISVVPKDDDGAFSDGISGVTGSGIQRLLENLEVRVSDLVHNVGLVGHERHADALRHAVFMCETARDRVRIGSEGYDLASEEIRMAAGSLESILGTIDIDSVYDVIFGRFCLGK